MLLAKQLEIHLKAVYPKKIIMLVYYQSDFVKLQKWGFHLHWNLNITNPYVTAVSVTNNFLNRSHDRKIYENEPRYNETSS